MLGETNVQQLNLRTGSFLDVKRPPRVSLCAGVLCISQWFDVKKKKNKKKGFPLTTCWGALNIHKSKVLFSQSATDCELEVVLREAAG